MFQHFLGRRIVFVLAVRLSRKFVHITNPTF